MYFQIIYDGLREPVRRALEALVMERQTEGKTLFPPFAQKIFDRGEVNGKRDSLLRLIARVGVELTKEDRARIQACTDVATLDRWFDKVLGAKTANDILD